MIVVNVDVKPKNLDFIFKLTDEIKSSLLDFCINLEMKLHTSLASSAFEW